MNQRRQKPLIIWVLQRNQLTPHIFEFIIRLKKNLSGLDIRFVIPENDREQLAQLASHNPLYFKTHRVDYGNTETNFSKKRAQIGSASYSGELAAWQALLLDDLGAGAIIGTTIIMDSLVNLKGIILQIPTPMGSRTEEENIFEAWIKWAHSKNVFISGYELLPLYNRWKLLPSALDGIITTNELSYTYLTNDSRNIPGKIWQLPRYEGNVFSLYTSSIWKKGLEFPYHFQASQNLTKEVSILYVSHNVAMSYEYRRLLEAIQEFGNRIHLMLSIGKDQVRGTHTHREIIKVTCGETLNKFHSFSFHELDAPWETVVADAIISCTHNHSTMIGNTCGIPCIVCDEAVPETNYGSLEVVNDHLRFKDRIAGIMSEKKQKTSIVNILYQIANKEHPQIAPINH